MRRRYVHWCLAGVRYCSLTGIRRLGPGELQALSLARLWHTQTGQSVGDRFCYNQFKVFDTDQRFAIRNKLWQIASENLTGINIDDTKASALLFHQAYVTGVGGNGKSHNLALFVHQAREAGAVVLYIHDMQEWINTSYIFVNELKFACAQRVRVSPPRDIPRVSSWGRLLAEHKMNITVELVREMNEECTKIQRPFIIVMDQDNRLNRISDNPLFHLFNNIVNSVQPHLLVLAASANNEGWERRTWPNRIEHFPEPVPEEHIGTLFPKLAMRDALRSQLSSKFKNYPLALGVANLALEMADVDDDAVLNSVEKHFVDKIVKYVRQLPQDLRRAAFEHAMNLLNGGSNVGSDSPSLEYDRNHVYIKDGELKSIFPFAADRLRDLLAQALPRHALAATLQLVPEAVQYEWYFWYAASVLLRPVGKSVRRFRLRYSFLTRSDVAPLIDTDAYRDALWLFKSPPNGQFFDFVAVRKWLNEEFDVYEYELTFYQLTMNMTHSPSHLLCGTQNQKFVGGDTILMKCKVSLAGVPPDRVRTSFLYVSPHKELKLEESKCGTFESECIMQLGQRKCGTFETNEIPSKWKAHAPKQGQPLKLFMERVKQPCLQARSDPGAFDGVYFLGNVPLDTLRHQMLEAGTLK